MFPLANSLNPLGSVAVVAGGSPTYIEAVTANATSFNRGDNFWVGFKFTPTKNISVHSLGRLKLSGNTQIHEVAIMDWATGFLLAITSVDMSLVSDGQYAYADLIADLPLLSGNSYGVYVHEMGTGDTWQHENTLTTTADVTPNTSAYASDGLLSLHRSDITGYVGYRVTPTGSQTITKLGRFKTKDTDSGSHTLVIMDPTSFTVLASVTINLSGQPTGMVYGTLATPYTMVGGTTYFIGSSEVAGGDGFFDVVTSLTVASGWTLVDGAYSTGSSFNSWYPWPVDAIWGSGQSLINISGLISGNTGSAGMAYDNPNFKYS